MLAQTIGRADRIQMRYPACDGQHTEQKLQAAKQELHRAQGSTQRRECDAVRKYGGAQKFAGIQAFNGSYH